MSATPYIAKTILNPRDAIASHVRWKITLLLATRMREQLSQRAIDAIHHPDECSIGKWLLSKHALHLRATPEFRAVVELHLASHDHMRQVAALIRAGAFEQAECTLNAQEPFLSTSNAFANALMALDRLPPAKPAN